MTLAAAIKPPSRSAPAVRSVALAWRRLTGGTARGRDGQRRTLVACSGGADSSALVLALAAAVGREQSALVVGHIVHDMRAAAEAHADRDSVRELAQALGLEFVESSVRVRAVRGNSEAVARRLRYEALAGLAREHGCGFLATAHHADDQLETMLMAMIRGAGPRGLSGVAESRNLGGGLRVIRPCLGLERAELERMCRDAGWEWREDATNADLSRTRAAIRQRVLPLLKALRPRAAQAAARTAKLLAASAATLDVAAEDLATTAGDGGELRWAREALRAAPGAVVGLMLRRAAATLLRGEGTDKAGQRGMAAVIRHLRSSSGERRVFALGGVRIVVEREVVSMHRSKE